MPNVEPVLAPHVADALRRHAPDISLDVHRMWPLDLQQAVADGVVDVGLTCGLVVDPPGVVGEVFCGERVLVGLRSTHRLADRESVDLTDLAGETFGIPSASLFPEWALGQRRVLEMAGIFPPTVELETTDVGATGWTRQSGVEWVMTGAALSGLDEEAALLPSTTGVFSYKLQWNSARTQTAAANTADLTQRNATFANDGFDPRLTINPRGNMMVVGCVDPRVDPAHVLGLSNGEAAIIRNVGGRITPSTLRTMTMLGKVGQANADTHVPGTWNLVILHHTDCGMTDLVPYPDLLAEYFETPTSDLAAKSVADPDGSVRVDVETILDTLHGTDFLVSGLVYDVMTGRLDVVVPPTPLRPT